MGQSLDLQLLAALVLAAMGIERATEARLKRMRGKPAAFVAFFAIAFCTPEIYVALSQGYLVAFPQAILHNTYDARENPVIWIETIVMIAAFVNVIFALFQLRRPALALRYRR